MATERVPAAIRRQRVRLLIPIRWAADFRLIEAMSELPDGTWVDCASQCNAKVVMV